MLRTRKIIANPSENIADGREVDLALHQQYNTDPAFTDTVLGNRLENIADGREG